MEPNNILTVVESSGLEPASAESLKVAFTPLFEQAEHWRQQVLTIRVTDVSQTKEMKLAHDTRMALRDIRVKAEKVRKSLKEDSLRKGKAIDGCYNVLEYLIVPLEKTLLEQEQFAERQEEARKAALRAERERQLAPFGVDLAFYNLQDMPEATFAELLTTVRFAHEAKLAEQRRAEEARMAAEKAAAEERERVRVENEKLKAAAVERERVLQAERAKAEQERLVAEQAARKEREEIEARARAERFLLEEAARKEREARERLEQERRDAADRERARLAAEAEATRKAAAAPDREKLRAYARQLMQVHAPEAATTGGQKIVREAARRVNQLVVWLDSEADRL